jgi:hypothetical protein
LEPSTNGGGASGTIANLIGGSTNNTIEQPGSAANVIVGGGSLLSTPGPDIIHSNSQYVFMGTAWGSQVGPNVGGGAIASGFNNIIGDSASLSFIGAGYNNWIFGYDSFIGGGRYNVIQSNALWSVLAGGTESTIGSNAFFATIGGGAGNIVNESASTIAGGQINHILVYADHAFIGGGEYNTIVGSFSLPVYAAIAGGYANLIQTNASYGFIGGGISNIIQSSFSATIAGGTNNSVGSDMTTIGGGGQNAIGSNSSSGTIAGGRFNIIGDNALVSTIGGGFENTVASGANYATIPGGSFNYAAGSNSLAAGNQAQATNDGTFVWADTEGVPFSSTGTNQFLVRASGGVGINTNNPGSAALNVAGTLRATSFQGDGSGLINVNAGALANYIFAYNNGVQAVATGNTFQDVNFATDAQLSGWMHASGTSQYTNAQTGLYLIQYNAEVSSTLANGTNAQMRAMLNGLEIAGSRSFATFTPPSQITTLSKSLIAGANASDVLTLQFTGSGTGVRLSGTANSTLTVTRIQ